MSQALLRVLIPEEYLVNCNVTACKAIQFFIRFYRKPLHSSTSVMAFCLFVFLKNVDAKFNWTNND